MELYSLDSHFAIAPAEVGGKAASLARLRVLGFPCPPGSVIPARVCGEVISALDPTFLPYLRATSHIEELRTRLADIRRRLSVAPIPLSLEAAIVGALEQASGPVAVRSSGLSEDGQCSAFAGAYSSYLDRKSPADVLQSVRDCWASAFSERVLAYRVQHGLLHAEWLLGVVIQKMIRADRAGVLFTCNPYRHDDTILIEAISGSCDQLVSGRPAEATLCVDRRTCAVAAERKGSLGSRFGQGAQDLLGSASVSKPNLLRRWHVEQLVATALRIETAFGAPQDIEWAIAGAEVWILQARPLTGYAAPEKE